LNNLATSGFDALFGHAELSEAIRRLVELIPAIWVEAQKQPKFVASVD
jgi:hypothetical protein